MTTWNLSAIETKYRDLVGMPDTNQLAQATAWAEINNYYQEHFPLDSDLPEFRQIYASAISTTAVDSGEYTVSDSIIAVREPITLFDASADYVQELTFYRDESLFFSDYPRDPDVDRGQPARLLWYGLKFYLRPMADAVYTVDMSVTRKPTTALSLGTDAPLSNAWGEVIAYGAALRKLSDIGDQDRIADVSFAFQYYLNLLTGKEIKRMLGVRPVPGF